MNDRFQLEHFDAFMGGGVDNVTQRGFAWRGVPILKTAPDLFMLAEAIFDTSPTVIVETGTWMGGSALFYADMLKLNAQPGSDWGAGFVISVDDISADTGRVTMEGYQVPGCLYLGGDSADPRTVDWVRRSIPEGSRVMVCLDSDHSAEHVRAELDAYAPMVTPGCYLVVEDTIMGGNPAPFDPGGGGPMAAVRTWLPDHPEFEVDKEKERYGLSFYPDGWLKRRIEL